jgi:hypothetical protein
LPQFSLVLFFDFLLRNNRTSPPSAAPHASRAYISVRTKQNRAEINLCDWLDRNTAHWLWDTAIAQLSDPGYRYRTAPPTEWTLLHAPYAGCHHREGWTLMDRAHPTVFIYPRAHWLATNIPGYMFWSTGDKMAKTYDTSRHGR